MRLMYMILPLLFFCGILCAGDARLKQEERRLMRAGFPADYAEKLARLQQRYKKWDFRVLHVSRMKPEYTWDHIMHMETDENPRRSLISGSGDYKAYFHSADTKLYDAGCRRASRETVAYFMDPRNFLNSRDIFQFLDLSSVDGIDKKTVNAALRGTFMEKGKLENNLSYGEYLIRVGRQFKINPVFLASRLRQEQGLQGTPLVSGKCGSLLARYYAENVQMEGRFNVQTPGDGYSVTELKKLDGLYNYFNIEAAGTGRFRIYLAGMREALKGTPGMTEKWKSPRWDTRWKAIYGGASKVAALYIGRHQNTLYLQKWNVDPRSRNAKGNSLNFWGQYMQNVGAAFSEGRNMQRSFADLKMLDLPFTFLIPVYSNMPENPSADPAEGTCAFYRQHEDRKEKQK